jgi:hypothetical protein
MIDMETAAPSVPAKGLFARAIGVLTSPKATFAAVVAHPKPAGILFLSALVIGLAQGAPQFTEKGRDMAVTMQVQQAEKFMGRELPPEAVDSMRARSAYGAYTTIAFSLIILPVFALLFGGIYWVVFNTILGGTSTFKQVLAVVAHSQVVGALGYVISAPIMYAQGVLSPGGPFNLGILAPMLDENSVVARVLAFTSVFVLWGLLTTGQGLGVLFKRSGLTIGIVLIVLYLAIAFGITSLFTR